MNKKLYCGAAKRDVTPAKNILNRLPGRSNTILDRLYVRAIALGDGEKKYLMICFDSGRPHIQKLYAELEKSTGLGSDDILITHTHTHSGISIEPTGSLPPNPRKRFHLFENWPKDQQDAMTEYGEFTTIQCVEAAVEALENMRPAKMGHAKGESFINVNRNQHFNIEQPDGSIKVHYATGVEPTHPIDHTLFVMKFVDAETEEPIAFFINYPVHCCVLISNPCGENGKVATSGDIAGNCSHYMEAKFPDSIAMWCSGAAGDINPIMGCQMVYPDPMTGEPKRIYSKHPELGLSMLKMLSTRHFADIMEVQRKIDRLTDKTEIITTVEWSETPGLDEFNVEHEGLYKVRMHAIRINDVVLIGVSGEMWDSYAKLVKDTSPFKDTYIINQTAFGLARSEYIIDDWGFEHSASPAKRMEMGPRDFPKNDNDPKAEHVMKFDGKIDDCMVGTEHTQIVPGYLSESFREHTLNIAEKLL